LVGSSSSSVFEGRSSMRATASRVRSPPDSTAAFLCTSSPENRNPPRMLRIAGTMSVADPTSSVS
jgi:hypothetical protein